MSLTSLDWLAFGWLLVVLVGVWMTFGIGYSVIAAGIVGEMVTLVFHVRRARGK